MGKARLQRKFGDSPETSKARQTVSVESKQRWEHSSTLLTLVVSLIEPGANSSPWKTSKKRVSPSVDRRRD